jgi:hypothetical protein
MAWTDEEIATLIRLVKQNLFAVQIAKEMHISRNAVIGKVHRLNRKDPSVLLAASPKSVTLEPRDKTKRVGEKKPMAKKRSPGRSGLVVRAEAPSIVPTVKWVPPKTRPGPVTVETRALWMCKWPTGRDKQGAITFCGQVRKDWSYNSNDETASPYCEEHHDRSYQPIKAPAKPRPRPHFAK